MLQSLSPDRFSSAECNPPAGEIQICFLLCRNPVTAKFVGKVWAAASGGAVMGNCGKPACRILQEGSRRHQDGFRSAVKRLQHISNQSHIVVKWQPSHDDVILSLAEGFLNQLLIVHE